MTESYKGKNRDRAFRPGNFAQKDRETPEI